jgi:hypothetical protein
VAITYTIIYILTHFGKTLNHYSIQDLKIKQTRTTVTSVAGDQRGQRILFSVVFTPSTSSHYGISVWLLPVISLLTN